MPSSGDLLIARSLNNSFLPQLLNLAFAHCEFSIYPSIVLTQARSRTTQAPRRVRKAVRSSRVGKSAGLRVGNLGEKASYLEVFRVEQVTHSRNWGKRNAACLCL